MLQRICKSYVTAMDSIGRNNIGHCPFSEVYNIHDVSGDSKKCFEVNPPLYSGDFLPLHGEIIVAF
jgi:hypothetical protein